MMDNQEMNPWPGAISRGFTSAVRSATGPFLVAGNANIALAREIAIHLGVSLDQAVVDIFPDSEIRVEIAESVAGAVVFIIQPTHSAQAIVELFLLLDTPKRARARRVIAVISYFGYARQDRRQGQEPLSAALMARLIEAAGADAVICLDLHNPAIEGFFRIPVLHLLPTSCFIERWQEELDVAHLDIAAPDAGGIRRALAYCQALGKDDPVVLHKRRTRVDNCRMLGVSRKVRGRTIMIVDDIIASGSTLLKAAEALDRRGAAAVYASVTHLVSTACLSKLADSSIERLFVSDSLPIPEDTPSKLSVVSVAPLLAEAIARFQCCVSGDVLCPQSFEMALPSPVLSRRD